MSESVFVLTHGAWHSASCWSQLTPQLEAMGHQVFCPDLPGHGNNKENPDSINLSSYTRYLTEYIEQIQEKVILVGHSMSGMVIAQAAENLPDRIERLVFLSAYLPCDGQSLFDLIAENRKSGKAAPIEQAMLMSDDKRTCSIDPANIKPLFYNRCAGEKEAFVPHKFPKQATLPLSGKVKLSEVFARLSKTYLCCLDDQVIPIDHQRHMLKMQECNEMIQLDADHSPFLSCPETLASILHSCSLGE